MEEKKFLESIEGGELDIAVYARSWEEGDNVTVTCDLLFAMEQAVGVFNEQKEEIEHLTGVHDRTLKTVEELNAKNCGLECAKAELQKQVDELKERCEIAEGTKNRLTIFDRIELHGKATKSTAEQIYKEIDKSDILVVQTKEYGEIEVVPVERLKEILKSKGVEVE